MSLRQVRRTWETLGRENPMWAVLTYRDDWDAEEFFATGKQEVEEELARAGALGYPGAFERALDFGCGLGRLTRAVGGRFDEAVGVDIAEPMVARARELNADFSNCSFVVNRRPDLSIFDDRHFDLVLSNITLQHMPSPAARRYIEEFVRVLRPGGIMLFQLPAVDRTAKPSRGPTAGTVARARRYAGSLRRRLRRQMEMHVTPKAEVLALLEATGARVLDVIPDEKALAQWEGYRYAATVEPGASAAPSDVDA